MTRFIKYQFNIFIENREVNWLLKENFRKSIESFDISIVNEWTLTEDYRQCNDHPISDFNLFTRSNKHPHQFSLLIFNIWRIDSTFLPINMASATYFVNENNETMYVHSFIKLRIRNSCLVHGHTIDYSPMLRLKNTIWVY